MKNIIDHIKHCHKNGVIIYPEYVHKDIYLQNVIQYKKNHWYMTVNNNGRITRLPTSLGVGTRINGKDISVQWNKSFIFFSNKLTKLGL